MFTWLLGKREPEPIRTYRFSEELELIWSPDSEDWCAELSELGEGARLHIVGRDVDYPSAAACALALSVRHTLPELVPLARDYLVEQSADFIKKAYRHDVTGDSWRPAGILIYDNQEISDEFTLRFDPIFDAGAVWKVRFRANAPCKWNFDD